MQTNIPKEVPFLPGHVFHDPYKQNYHKTRKTDSSLMASGKLRRCKFISVSSFVRQLGQEGKTPKHSGHWQTQPFEKGMEETKERLP